MLSSSSATRSRFAFARSVRSSASITRRAAAVARSTGTSCCSEVRTMSAGEWPTVGTLSGSGSADVIESIVVLLCRSRVSRYVVRTLAVSTGPVTGEVPPTGKPCSRAGFGGEDGEVESDRLAITTLTARYARAVDRRDGAALTALFTPDAVLVLPPVLNAMETTVELAGRQGVVSSVMDAVSRFVLTRHVVEQHVL